MRTRTIAAAAAAVLAWVASASAQEWKVVEDPEWCDEGRWDADWCEVRELTLPATGERIEVDGGRNGGVAVHGWDRDEIQVQVQVRVWDLDDADEAREYASRIEVEPEGPFEAKGPSRHDRGPNWSVSYRLRVPRESSLGLEAHNGGITVVDVRGDIEFTAHNGGIRLALVGGDVHGTTKNGGVKVVLDGETWTGEGLDVETTNGGIDLEVPGDYSARLLVSTVNGGIRTDFPVEATGRRTKSLRATIGDGGALLRLTTKNGGVSIRQI